MNDTGSRTGPAVTRRAPRPPRRVTLALSALAVGGLAVGVRLASPDAGSTTNALASAPEPTTERIRALSTRSACLLTDSHGVEIDPAGSVWAGVRDAAAAAKARASFLALVAGAPPQAQANALIAQRCTVVLAVGKKPVAAVESIAASAPATVQLATAGAPDNGRLKGFIASRAAAKTITARLLGGSNS